MNKIDMYKEVPQGFHNALCETLEQLEEEKIVKFSAKKFIITCAAAVLAASTLTVGAMELFQWYQAARESLGTNQELENKLTNKGVALPAEDADVQQEITMTALQAVKTNEDFYLLAAMDWPEGLEWNEDILFEECGIALLGEAENGSGIQDCNSKQEAVEKEMQTGENSKENGTAAGIKDFGGFTVNFAGAPDENGTIYLEMLARGISGTDYSGVAKVTLTNLIQTRKTDYVDTLVEAQWELTFRLPVDADTMLYEVKYPLLVNGHALTLENVEISPFGVKLYAHKEQAMHAAYYSNMELAAVLYEDGSRMDNYGGVLKTAGAADETGRFYFNLTLQNAVDIGKVSGLVFKEDDQEYIYGLGEGTVEQTSANISSGKDEQLFVQAQEECSLGELMSRQYESELATNMEASKTNAVEVTDLYIIYVRYDYVTFRDNRYIYQWDAACDRAEIIADLAEWNFDAANGGEVAMMPGGMVLTVHPTADSNQIYMVETDTHNMYEAENIMWPIPGYEDYRSNFFAVAEAEDLAEGAYAPEGYEAQGSAYVLYSPDGSVEKLELVEVNR